MLKHLRRETQKISQQSSFNTFHSKYFTIWKFKLTRKKSCAHAYKAIGLDTVQLIQSRMENIKSLQRGKWENMSERRKKTIEKKQKKNEKHQMAYEKRFTFFSPHLFFVNHHKCIPFFVLWNKEVKGKQNRNYQKQQDNQEMKQHTN